MSESFRSFSFKDGHERYRWLLATPFQRIMANVMDAVLWLLAIVPVLWEVYVDKVQWPQLHVWPLSDHSWSVLSSAVLVLACMLVQAVLLASRGQTVGKMVMDIRVIRDDGHLAGFFHVLVLRTLVFALLSAVLIGGLLNVLHLDDNFTVYELIWLPYLVCVPMLFNLGDNSVTLQDKLANTVVVQRVMRRINH